MIIGMLSYGFRSPVQLRLFLGTFAFHRIPILEKMSSGSGGGFKSLTQSPNVKVDRRAIWVEKGSYSSTGGQNSPQKSIDGAEECLFNSASEVEFPSISASLNNSSKRRTRTEPGMQSEQKSEQRVEKTFSRQLSASLDSQSASQPDELPSPTGFQREQVLVKQCLQTSPIYPDELTYSSDFQKKRLLSRSDRPHPQRTSLEQAPIYRDEPTYSSDFQKKHLISRSDRPHPHRTSPEQGVGLFRETKCKPFDICFSDSRKQVLAHGEVLRPGMVLLKSYIPLSQQVEIILRCRELGLGSGGFYQPGYQDGAKLRLQMMCLGQDWNPQTRKYGRIRQHDNSKPPDIPPYFNELIKRVLHDAHALIKEQSFTSDVEEILPSMSPDICIVNFYSTNGRLGLHQDRDESGDSLRRGLPVVSFSIGDSAEFSYGDQRDIDKAESVLLESGDVLIFGGESRHIFHGVTSIIPKTTPKALKEVTKLRPGRLNLTFRQF